MVFDDNGLCLSPVPCFFSLVCSLPWRQALESLPSPFFFLSPSPSFEVVSCCRDFSRSVPAAWVSPKQIQPFTMGARACIRLSFACIPTHLRTYVRNGCYIVFLNHHPILMLADVCRLVEKFSKKRVPRKRWNHALGQDNYMSTYPRFLRQKGLVTGNMCRTELIIRKGQPSNANTRPHVLWRQDTRYIPLIMVKKIKIKTCSR